MALAHTEWRVAGKVARMAARAAYSVDRQDHCSLVEAENIHPVGKVVPNPSRPEKTIRTLSQAALLVPAKCLFHNVDR